MSENIKSSLNKIKITNLFNTFNHTVDIKREKGITLILGENGLGKTVILKMLKLVFEGDFIQLKNYEFERLDFYFDDCKYSFFGTTEINNPRLLVKQFKGRNAINEFNLLSEENIAFRNQGSHFLETSIRHRYDNDFLYDENVKDKLENFLRKSIGRRSIERIGHDRWLDRRRDIVVNTNTIIKNYKKYLPKSFTDYFTTPPWLQELSDRAIVYLIETQRLRTRKGSDNYEDAIIKISNELSETIKEVLAQANEFATQLDRTYPTRLLTKINDELERISDEDLEIKLEELDLRRKRLKEVGLVEPFEDNIQRTNVGHRSKGSTERTELINNVLLVYIQDSNEKLDIYEHIANKLEVFVNILNERLNVKKIIIDKEKGLDIKSTKFDENSAKKKKKIPLRGLSSGEQHMIIMFYNLLFKCEKNSLILIDEPEISLHIGWQNKFIDDLNRIKVITPFDAIIATHSPDIINDNWDLTVQLLDE
ncbi:AAA family ATPase [Pareuzebyella sediminis]|uniref:AAA family ATPase n=1 Tax=Pareuzebyella sediminis TaxID=2607998 RepID=UPI0011EBFE62|nr:AAA family ATPase [Pareuzebyella sediminis]